MISFPTIRFQWRTRKSGCSHRGTRPASKRASWRLISTGELFQLNLWFAKHQPGGIWKTNVRCLISPMLKLWDLPISSSYEELYELADTQWKPTILDWYSMSTGIYIPTMSFQDVFWATCDISKITCAVMNQNTNHPAKTRALEPSTMSCAQNASMSSSCRHAAHIQFGSTCFGYVLLRENKYCKCHGQDMINHGSDILWSSV